MATFVFLFFVFFVYSISYGLILQVDLQRTTEGIN